MVPFKQYFTGQKTAPFARAVSAQKCLRVAGKHNDLEEVGRTPKHHTFFEMLGNFSFGDYFKPKAIELAWRFLTEEIGLDTTRLVATVFEGDTQCPADEEAYSLWQKDIGLPKDHIYRLSAKDNFWAMGNTGPCGPCSEVHYFMGPQADLAASIAAGGPDTDERWVEIWNLVFMQYQKKSLNRADLKNGGDETLDSTAYRLEPLAKPGIDTGMGLERLAAVVGGYDSTYQCDNIQALIDEAAHISGHTVGKDPEVDTALRVIADHGRAIAFCIADGVFPEKSGREYVLRRISRRAIRFGKKIGIETPFFHQICAKVTDVMGDHYPELVQHRDVIVKVAEAEELAFRRTLDRGLSKLHKAIKKAQDQGATQLGADMVGDLYATDGFPTDLTKLIAEESDLLVDEAGAKEWVKKTHGAKNSKIGNAETLPVLTDIESQYGLTQFDGYTATTGKSKVIALVDSQGQATESLQHKQSGIAILDRTPFYAQSGGQVGDTGTFASISTVAAPDQSNSDQPSVICKVQHTTKSGAGLFAHHIEVENNKLTVGDVIHCQVDESRRQALSRNHSATHLLHAGLKATLGSHVAQKGSEVSEKSIRFDVSHFDPLSPEEIAQVEQLIHQHIRANYPVEIKEMSYADALTTGATALFGEKYGDKVRVVHIGPSSVELCGGTHVSRSGDIGHFRITSDESLAMGIRRIVATSGDVALTMEQERDGALRKLSSTVQAGPKQLVERVEKLIAENKALTKELVQLRQKVAVSESTEHVFAVGDIDVLIANIGNADMSTLRNTSDVMLKRVKSGVIVIGSVDNDAARIIARVTKDAQKRVHAGKLVNELAKVLDGKGGGRPDFAQAGGSNTARLQTALDGTKALVERFLAQ